MKKVLLYIVSIYISSIPLKSNNSLDTTSLEINWNRTIHNIYHFLKRQKDKDTVYNNIKYTTSIGGVNFNIKFDDNLTHNNVIIDYNNKLIRIKNSQIFKSITNVLQEVSNEMENLQNRYLDIYHKVYIIEENKPPQIDIKGNLYLPRNFLKNKQLLNLTMLHEAFHLFPINIDNEYIKQLLFTNVLFSYRFKEYIMKNFSKKNNQNTNFSDLNVKYIKQENTFKYYFDNNTYIVTSFPNFLRTQFISLLNTEEYIIDLRVLGYIHDDYKLCREYYELIDSKNKKRAKIIKEVCNYMKKNPFTLKLYSNDFLPLSYSIRDIILDDKINIKEKSAKIKRVIYENIVSKRYKKGEERELMSFIYSIMVESMLERFDKFHKQFKGLK